LHGLYGEFFKNFSWKTERRRLLLRPRYRWEVKVLILEIGYEVLDWILLSQNKDHWLGPCHTKSAITALLLKVIYQQNTDLFQLAIKLERRKNVRITYIWYSILNITCRYFINCGGVSDEDRLTGIRTREQFHWLLWPSGHEETGAVQ
jgi:hypothetical protein